MDDPEQSYRALCSSETLRSGSKGFFYDFGKAVIEEVGDGWITKIFGKAKDDEERVKIILTDGKIKDVVSRTLNQVRELYRDKDAGISRSKRLDGAIALSTGDYEKALVLFSQAVLRAPSRGKNPSVDEGFTLPLALYARADVFLALKDYRSALEDLRLAAEEGLPDAARTQLYWKTGKCQRGLGFREKARVCLELARSEMLGAQREAERRAVARDIAELDERVAPAIAEDARPKPPAVTGGASADLPGASRLVRIEETPSVGRHAVAAEEIRTGDVLAVEAPLASCLLPDFYGTHCHQCFARLRAPVGCPTCSSVAFCGVECRDAALTTYHKYECKILALLIGSGMSVLSTVALRMVTQMGLRGCLKAYEEARVRRSADAEEEEATPVEENHKLSKSAKRRLRKKKLKESESSTAIVARENHHRDDIDARAFELVTLAEKRSPADFLERSLMAAFMLKCLQRVGFFERPSKLDEPPDPEEIIVGATLLRNLQLLQFNAHEVYETRLGSEHRFRGSRPVYLGVAIYPTVAFFNHDCYPAVTRYFVGRNIVIRAIRPLKPGDVVAENYGPIFTKRTLAERQRVLSGRYWFKCTCTACRENWPEFKTLTNEHARLRCPTEGCTRALARPREAMKSVKCPGCQKRVNLDDRLANLQECEAEYERCQAIMEAERPGEAVEGFAQVLDKFHAIATPPHRDTHLAQIAIGACMADSGNTWKPPS